MSSKAKPATDSTSHYDAVVLGCGGVGSAALYHLARRGTRVLGLDRFNPPHDQGSSHGETRIIRLAYFEHPDYVPLLRRAFELWEALERDSGQRLYQETGLLQVGPLDGRVLPAVFESAANHDLEVEELNAATIERRFPGFQVPTSMHGAFERRAGSLRVEACVAAHLALATRHGGELRTGVTVEGWHTTDTGVGLQTDRGSITADKLVITAGAWAEPLLTDLGIQLEVRRKSLFWYPTNDTNHSAAHGCPAFLFEGPAGSQAGIFYGFPRLDGSGVKVGEHSGGQPVADPLAVDRKVDPGDQSRIEAFLARHLPSVRPPHNRHATCLYTLTDDEHFLVDRHPRFPQVAFAAGLSGHGFKLAGVLGEALADLSLDGSTSLPIDFLSAARFR